MLIVVNMNRRSLIEKEIIKDVTDPGYISYFFKI